MARYALAIFWSAWLLFLVQPMMGKQVLPRFGGSPAVWTACLLFFQVVLLAGYAYAHALSALARPRSQALVHLALVAGSLWFLPIVADPQWRATVGDSPTWQILGLLAVTVGGPYFILSTTGPLLQDWFARAQPGRSPYRLYALSNVGSLLALLAYPFVVEPALAVAAQARAWSWGYGLFALACLACAVPLLRSSTADGAAGDDVPQRAAEHASRTPGWGLMSLWLGLAASASVMLLATTNQMCQEVAVVPFLWVLPLTVYLLSFVISFDGSHWYVRPFFGGLLIACAVLACALLIVGSKVPIRWQIAGYTAILFACSMSCHGELARAKPDARHLTLFYLLVATGGALGGIFVALVAPAIFSGYWEYHVGLVSCGVLVLLAMFRDARGGMYRGRPAWAWAVLSLGVAGLAALLVIQVNRGATALLDARRNFYGVLRVWKERDRNGPLRLLAHGGTKHGFQYQDEDKRRWPTSYFGPGSGVALALDGNPRRQAATPSERSLHVGIIGLGIGTIATWGRTGDTIRFYEINPEVPRLANEYFTYLEDSPAATEVVIGDARLNLEAELASAGSHQFDVLAMDAFSSDAIPMHLVTRECVEMYWRHLKPDGILLLNVTNRNVDLGPLVRGLAAAFGKAAVHLHTDDDPRLGTLASDWAILTSNEEFLASPELQTAGKTFSQEAPPLLWTDDYGSLRQVLRK